MFNSANYNEVANATTVVGTSGGPSYYGTYDQCGNCYEWTEGNGPDIGMLKTKSARGGRYIGRNADLGLRKDYLHFFPPEQKAVALGFRLCSQGVGETYDRGVLIRNQLSNPLRWSEFVLVRDIGNQPDELRPVGRRYKDGNPEIELELNPATPGAVDYAYLIQKCPTTVEEYCEFLNAVAIDETHGVFAAALASGGDPTIELVGSQYRPLRGKGRKPITHVNWYDAARFANWLSNGKPVGGQTSSTTEDGAYTLLGVMRPANVVSISRNATNPNTGQPPTYWLPSEDEWHKAAYYKGGSTDAGYWTYATGSDTPPQCCTRDKWDNGSAAAPLPYHEHNTDGETIALRFVDIHLNEVVMEFRDGLLVGCSSEGVADDVVLRLRRQP